MLCCCLIYCSQKTQNVIEIFFLLISCFNVTEGHLFLTLVKSILSLCVNVNLSEDNRIIIVVIRVTKNIVKTFHKITENSKLRSENSTLSLLFYKRITFVYLCWINMKKENLRGKLITLKLT